MQVLSKGRGRQGLLLNKHAASLQAGSPSLVAERLGARAAALAGVLVAGLLAVVAAGDRQAVALQQTGGEVGGGVSRELKQADHPRLVLGP